jgi:N-acetylneuraminic acid mutarotase
MMRLLKIVIAFTCVLITTNTKAQTNPAFAWISGADTVKSSGIYGALNTFAPTNLPPARQNSCSWNSNDQKLWLFGGSVTGSSGSNSYFNDLWAYDISSGQWAWISGANTPDQHGHYGTLGIASSANYPGARQNASTWTDHAGNFWLFGGQGFAAGGGIGYLSDLWKFDPTVNQWTWVAGSNVINQSDHFGTLGTPSSSNAPGARFGALSWYDDSSNKLYLFGGQKNGGTADRANDLWSYDISSAEWTWI